MKGKRKNTLRLSSSFTSTACISCLLVCIWSFCLFVCLFSPSRTWLKSWILLSRQILFHQKTGPRTNRFSCVLLFIIVSVHTISIWCTTASKKNKEFFCTIINRIPVYVSYFFHTLRWRSSSSSHGGSLRFHPTSRMRFYQSPDLNTDIHHWTSAPRNSMHTDYFPF